MRKNYLDNIRFLLSYAATFLNVALVKRIPLVRTLFGAK